MNARHLYWMPAREIIRFYKDQLYWGGLFEYGIDFLATTAQEWKEYFVDTITDEFFTDTRGRIIFNVASHSHEFDFDNPENNAPRISYFDPHTPPENYDKDYVPTEYYIGYGQDK